MNNNNVRLIGYVGKYPVTKIIENGRKRTVIKVATHYPKKERGSRGESEYGTVWHWVIAWGSIAEFAERSFVKGSKILVEGTIVYREYKDKEGLPKNITDIHANSLINLDR